MAAYLLMLHFSDFLNVKIAKATTYLVLESVIPGRCIVPERTWPGCGKLGRLHAIELQYHIDIHVSGAGC